MSNAFKKPNQTSIASVISRSQAFVQEQSGPQLPHSKLPSSQLPSSKLPISQLPIAKLVANPKQPRKYFSEERLSELASSIKEHGILQPLMVRPIEGDHIEGDHIEGDHIEGDHIEIVHFEIVYGERRYRAAQIAGLNEIPVIIRNLTDSEVEVVAAIENLQRDDLNRFDEVTTKLRLVAGTLACSSEEAEANLKSFRANQVQYAAEIEQMTQLFKQLGGESWLSFVTNGLPVLRLPELVLLPLQQGKLEYSKAVLIARAPAETQAKLIEETLQQRLTQAELTQRIKALKPATEETKASINELKRKLTPKKLSQLEPQERRKVDKLLQELHGLLA